MKRTVVLSSLFAALTALTVACAADPPSTLENGGPSGNIANQNDDDTTKTKKEAQTTPAASSSSTPKPATTTTTPKPASTATSTALDPSCDPAKTTTKEQCGECCALKTAPVKAVDDCACGVTSACATTCGDNFCKTGIPSIECGFCLLQNQCDFGNLGGDNGDNGDVAGTAEALSCIAQCASKP